jgi:hypothetical protein
MSLRSLLTQASHSVPPQGHDFRATRKLSDVPDSCIRLKVLFFSMTFERKNRAALSKVMYMPALFKMSSWQGCKFRNSGLHSSVVECFAECHKTALLSGQMQAFLNEVSYQPIDVFVEKLLEALRVSCHVNDPFASP